MTDKDIKTISEKIDSLHKKILKSNFAEKVTESEMMSLILAVQELNRQKTEIERLQKKNTKKCGSCLYAIPATFGKSKVYVECTNWEHIKKFCKREISLKRQRTTPACKHYKEMVGE